MRVAGSWQSMTDLWLIWTSACACVCVCVCVPLSVHCSCCVLGCCRVLLFTLHSATCTPVCLCCYCVCWLQFTQIWPYCRQVSLLWEVLQRDPGQQCDPGGRPGTATDVSYQARVAEHHQMIILRDYIRLFFSLDLILWKGFSVTGANMNLVVSFISLFVQHDIKRAVWKEEKWHVGLWTVSTTWTVIDSHFRDDRDALLLLARKAEKNLMFVIAGLLNVKTVDERCIRSVCCITMSFGRQGKSHYSCWTTIQPFKHIQSMFGLNRINSTGICICQSYCMLTLNYSLILLLLALSVTTVWRSLANQERRTSFQPKVSIVVVKQQQHLMKWNFPLFKVLN